MKKVTEYLQYLFDFFWHNFKKKLFTINSILHYLSYILFQTSTKFWPRISTRFRITAAALFPTIGKTRCSRPSLDTLFTAAVDLGHRVHSRTFHGECSCSSFPTTLGRTSGDQHVHNFRPRVTAAGLLECLTACRCSCSSVPTTLGRLPGDLIPDLSTTCYCSWTTDFFF